MGCVASRESKLRRVTSITARFLEEFYGDYPRVEDACLPQDFDGRPLVGSWATAEPSLTQVRKGSFEFRRALRQDGDSHLDRTRLWFRSHCLILF